MSKLCRCVAWWITHHKDLACSLSQPHSTPAFSPASCFFLSSLAVKTSLLATMSREEASTSCVPQSNWGQSNLSPGRTVDVWRNLSLPIITPYIPYQIIVQKWLTNKPLPHCFWMHRDAGYSFIHKQIEVWQTSDVKSLSWFCRTFMKTILYLRLCEEVCAEQPLQHPLFCVIYKRFVQGGS